MRIEQPTDEALKEAAAAIRAGRLIGMPTETVYGVAADASNPEAVLATFEAKGRPAENPLIVHVASIEDARRLVSGFPAYALTLAEMYWPGPMTLVLPKGPQVPPETTAGLETVAVRVPDHPVALRLIAASGRPISAPSANRFMGLSPTSAEDIEPSVGDRLHMVLDGGRCRVGIESTVVDCTGDRPLVLRPGMAAIATEAAAPSDRRSPGMYPRHYSPRSPLRIVESLGARDAGITLKVPQNPLQIRLPSEPVAYASELYATLHLLDRCKPPEILVEAPPTSQDWAAIWDRLRKAQGS